MIRVFKFRKNDLNASLGKQIEFNKDVVSSFFKFTEEEVDVKITYKSINTDDVLSGKQIKNKLKLSPSRGDYKIYGNPDGSENMKDFFLNTLHLNDTANINDYFALMKKGLTDYDLYYLPASTDINSFFSAIGNHTFELSPIMIEEEKKAIEQTSKQVIYYGAPGTGKSHVISEITNNESVVRTTFHPDSDYSTFVGCYKPTTKEEPRYTSYGEKAMTIKDENGNILTEDRIVYEFVDQAFLQAYIQAWKYYANADIESIPQNHYLVIEEINRGNCAQIFGDLFQLLDRNKYGFSDYPIQANNDMRKHLKKAFKDLTIAQEEKINTFYKGKNYVNKVLNGEILLLPNNLYIWATMNTSDQSLFPIDSAFKRRWDWQYMPIKKGCDEHGKELNWEISADTKKYDWWSFLSKINEQIASTTNSEDKKLGFFFCNATNGCISAETFVGKVIFYLWNDVFKDFGFEGMIFNDTDGTTLSFPDFYKIDNNGGVLVQKDKVQLFLDNLEVDVVLENTEEDDDGQDDNNLSKDFTKYKINGESIYSKKQIATELVKLYIKNNPNLSANQVVNDWKSLGGVVSHFIETEEEHNARTDNSPRVNKLQCGNSFVYVSTNGWTKMKMQELKTAIKIKNWGLEIEEA